jgi:hypothetical protein
MLGHCDAADDVGKKLAAKRCSVMTAPSEIC